MRRTGLQLLIVAGSLLLAWGAGALREYGRRLMVRSYTGLGYQVLALVPWLLIGLGLGLPAILRARRSGSSLRLHWPTLLIYGLPGLILALLIPLEFAGVHILTYSPLMTLASNGGQGLGALLVGFGLAQALAENGGTESA